MKESFGVSIIVSIIGYSKKLSIRWKLTTLYVLMTCIMLFSASKFIDLVLHSSLSTEENEFIYSRLHSIRAIIEQRKDYSEIIRNVIEWEGAYTAYPEYYVRIIDENKQLIVQTPGMDKYIPADWAPPPPTGEGHGEHDAVRKSANGRYYLLKSDAIQLPSSAEKKLLIQIALDVTSQATIDKVNHERIDLFLLLGTVLFAGGGILVIGRVLKPLDDMIAIADRITAEKITERVDATNLPKELRSYAQAFNSMMGRLEDAFTRLSHCASNLAHELRTPVNNLMGEAEIALSQERTPEEYKKIIESAMEEGGRLSRIIDSLLFLARAENPSTQITRSLFDPLAEIENIFGFFEPLTEAKAAVLTCTGNGLLNADPILFRRVIMNLVTNSLYYSGQGVTVEITVRQSDDSSCTEVVVRDTGVGMEERAISRIFDRFYRADDSRSRYSEGSGLGLSIVKAIMDLHHGTVTVSSKAGQGTTFTLRFPARSITTA